MIRREILFHAHGLPQKKTLKPGIEDIQNSLLNQQLELDELEIELLEKEEEINDAKKRADIVKKRFLKN